MRSIKTMIQVKPRFQSFEEYLSYNDGTNRLYELFNGELIEVPPESRKNVQIATFLLFQFALLLGTDRVRGHGLELEVNGEPRNRYLDLTILREEHIELLAKRNTIRLSMSPPLLVVEVVLKDTLKGSAVPSTEGTSLRVQQFAQVGEPAQYACGIPLGTQRDRRESVIGFTASHISPGELQ